MGRLACTTLYTMDSLFIQECIDKQANRIFPYLMSNFLVINDIYKRINMKQKEIWMIITEFVLVKIIQKIFV